MRFWKGLTIFAMLVLMVAWMGCIYYMSAQNSTQSSELSERVARWLLRHFDIQVAKRDFAAFHSFVRKAAHFTVYMGLGAWGYLFLRVVSTRLPGLFSWTFSFCFAMTDEYHQLSVQGRGGMMSDVWIDASGALLGVCFMAALLWVLTRVFRPRRI